MIEPSPLRAVCKKVFAGVVCAAIFVKFLPMFPISRVKEDDFVENTSVTQKLVYLYVCTALVRFKYYFAWTLADAVCNNAGIGFNGVDENGATKWDKFSNVDILGFEVRVYNIKCDYAVLARHVTVSNLIQINCFGIFAV